MIKNRRYFFSIISFLILCAVFIAKPAQAIQFELGVSLSAVVTRIAANNDSYVDQGIAKGDTVASSLSQASYGIYFSIVGEENYFGDTNVGWTYQVWASPFETDHQELDDGSFEDINTSISGWYFYALPLIYYRLGDKVGETARGWKATLGLGYGLSYTEMKGNVELTEIEGKPTYDVNASGLYYSVGLIGKFAYKKWFFSISNLSPQIVDDDFIYRIHNVSYAIGYEFELDFNLDDYL